MRIIFVIPNMTGGGTERVISLLANEYRRRGIGVTILMFAGEECAYRLDPGVELLCVSPQSYGDIRVQWKRLCRMRKYFRENSGSLIYSFSVMGTVFSAIAAVGLHCPMLVSERNDPRRGRQGPMRDLAYARAVKIAVQTRECAGYFPRFLQKKTVVIPNPVDLTLPKPFEGEREKTAVFVGRLHRQKNPGLLLEAFAIFVEKFPEYMLHMYGEGELEIQLKKISENLSISNRIVWHGFCPDVRSRIVKAGMYILSSDFEGISNSMLEAMAMGIPVIATDCPIGGSATYIRDGENGLLVPVGDRDRLAQAMLRLASDPKLAARVCANGAKIREQYPVWVIADRLLEAAGAGDDIQGGNAGGNHNDSDAYL